MNKDPIRTQNAKKVLIKDQVLKIRTLLKTSVFDVVFENVYRKCSIYYW